MREEEPKIVFYTTDPEYQQFNDMSFEVLRKIDEALREGDARYAIRLENGVVIRAFEDEMNGFIREHEQDPVLLPVCWTESGLVKMPSQKIYEAIEMFCEKVDEIPLPEGTYVCDSFALEADSDGIALYNHPFRNPERSRNTPHSGDESRNQAYWIPAEQTVRIQQEEGRPNENRGVCRQDQERNDPWQLMPLHSILSGEQLSDIPLKQQPFGTKRKEKRSGISFLRNFLPFHRGRDSE